MATLPENYPDGSGPRPSDAVAREPGSFPDVGSHSPGPDDLEDRQASTRIPLSSRVPTIRVEPGNLDKVATKAEDAIKLSGRPIFQRGHHIVRPAVQDVPASGGRRTKAAVLMQLESHALSDEFCRAARWEGPEKRKASVGIDPPKRVADILLSRFGQWNLPIVAGIITTPTMRPDGSILSAPGYDAETRLYHAADPNIKIAELVNNPTKGHAEIALQLLTDLLADFPFTSDGARSVGLSGLITPVVRGVMAAAPLHAFRATTAGTGKSYLVDIANVISGARPCPTMAFGKDEKENESRLTGLLLAAYPIACLDNVNGELGSDLLCQAIERPLVRLRRLGTSDITEIENRVTLYATGNGLRVRGDMTRRTLIADLDAAVERPELREFRGDPIATVMANRSRYVSACLVIVRAFLVAGRPGLLPPIASFGDWSDTVRSALVWLGCADPAETMEKAREDDPEQNELQELMDAWHAMFGRSAITSRTAIDTANGRVAGPDPHGHSPRRSIQTEARNQALLDALMQVAANRGEVDSVRLGRRLMDCQGRIVGGRRFKKDGSTGGAARWRLESL